MNYAEESLKLHEQWKGKIEVTATVPVETESDLSLAYTPGVAQPCLEIQKDTERSYDLTRRHNLCRYYGWNGCPGPGRYRTRSRHASNGGKMCVVQILWRCGRISFVY